MHLEFEFEFEFVLVLAVLFTKSVHTLPCLECIITKDTLNLNNATECTYGV